MPKGNTPTGPRHTEVVARESITHLLLEVLPLLRSDDPRAWETAGFKLDEAADMARITERELSRRAGSFAQAHVPASGHVVILSGSHVAPGFLSLLKAMGGGRR